jgi:hypothetical protein
MFPQPQPSGLSGSAHARPRFFAATRRVRKTTAAWSLLLGIAAAGLPGCGVATFIVQQYDGAPIAEERIAILRVNGDEHLRLEELDGEVLAYEVEDPRSRVHIEMLPGEHELGLVDGHGVPLKRRRFVAEPGKVYRPMVYRHSSPSGQPSGDWSVAIYEVDRGSDAIIREISQVPLSGSSPATVPSRPESATPAAATSIATSEPGTIAPTTDDGATAPSNVTPVPLPNTLAHPEGTSVGEQLAPTVIPPNVAPAKGPEGNLPPPEAVPQ